MRLSREACAIVVQSLEVASSGSVVHDEWWLDRCDNRGELIHLILVLFDLGLRHSGDVVLVSTSVSSLNFLYWTYVSNASYIGRWGD